jgi:hypothetical protein
MLKQRPPEMNMSVTELKISHGSSKLTVPEYYYEELPRQFLGLISAYQPSVDNHSVNSSNEGRL